jgi:hypothetical protein
MLPAQPALDSSRDRRLALDDRALTAKIPLRDDARPSSRDMIPHGTRE